MATTFGPKASDGVTTGTTPVAIVAAPAGSVTRIVKTVTVFNSDTEARVVTLTYLSNSNLRVVAEQELQVGESLIFGGDGEILVLDATTKSVTVTLDSAPLANQLDWTTHYADYAST